MEAMGRGKQTRPGKVAMIQVHTIESVEAAIQMGCLIPKDAPPKSRHRFWIGKHRVDAYLNADGVLFIHWLNRVTKRHEHPRIGGMRNCRIYTSGSESCNFYVYSDEGKWTREFRPSLGNPERV